VPQASQEKARFIALFGEFEATCLPLSWQGGHLRFWLKGEADDCFLATEYCGERAYEVRTGVEPPEGLSWVRYALSGPVDQLVLKAGLPTRPVFVRTLMPIVLPPRARAAFYVSLPLAVEIGARMRGDREETVMLDTLLTQRLSDSWYGDTMKGEYCFSLKSRARRELGDTAPEANDARAKVWMENLAPESFRFDKFCIHTDPLALYLSGDGFWTSTTTMTRKEQADQLHFQVGKEPPLANLKLSASPRRETAHGLFHLPFATPWTR